MTDRLWLILGFACGMLALYLACMRSTPRRGMTRVMERVCAGVVLFYLCSAALKLCGVSLAQSPLAAVSAGYLGLPGAALAALAQLWP